MIGIYKITNPNGKIYIGQSKNIKLRIDTYRRLNKQVSSSPKLYRSFLKYGFISHKIEVIEECSIELLNERERFWQEFYNVIELGLNCILTNTKDKRKISKSISDEHKKKISEFHKGKKLSQETIEKIKIARLKQIITDQHKINISKNSASARIVLDINTGVFYNSVKELANLYNLKSNTLICKLIGKNKNNTNFIYV
jgi:group I intron endonuclease